MAKIKFPEGVRLTTVETKYGEILKLGFKMEKFKENPVNEKGYLNIDILTSKEGKKYLAINEYSKPVDAETIKEEFSGTEINEEDIPF